MAYDNQQQQRPAMVKPALSPEEAEVISELTRRDKWKAFPVEDIILMWDAFPPGPPQTILGDFKRFVRTAAVKNLDPLINDIHFEYRNDKKSPTGVKGSIVTHQDGLLKIAHRSGLLDGIEQANGKDERDWYVESYVFKRGCSRPFVFRAYYYEFVATGFEGKPTYMWERSPYNMTAKCSRAGALRLAFPEELAGVIAPEEVEEDFRGMPRGTGDAPTPSTPALTINEKKDAPTPTPFITTLAGHEPWCSRAGKSDPPGVDCVCHQSSRSGQPETVKSEPAKAEPPKSTPTPAPAASAATPSAQSTQAAQQDPVAAYKTRLAIIVGKDSAYAKAGVTKTHVDAFLVSYFGVESVGKLPKTPEKYPPILDDLIVQLSEGAAGRLIEAPATFGQYRLRVAGNAPAASAPAPTVNPLAAELKARFNWASADLIRNAMVFLDKYKVDGIITVDDLKNLLLDPAGLLALTEPQLEIALSVAYYGADALGVFMKAFRDTNTPVSQLKADTEIICGRLDSWTLDPDKVFAAIKAAAAKATPARKPAFGMPA